jgi:hypothetical protein
MPHVISNLALPFSAALLINKMLAHSRCTTDHILILADALDELLREYPPGPSYCPQIRGFGAHLRDIAPGYTHPRGKPHGDFDGTLTP